MMTCSGSPSVSYIFIRKKSPERQAFCTHFKAILKHFQTNPFKPISCSVPAGIRQHFQYDICNVHLFILFMFYRKKDTLRLSETEGVLHIFFGIFYSSVLIVGIIDTLVRYPFHLLSQPINSPILLYFL